MAQKQSAYPDDANQNKLDRNDPPIRQSAALSGVTDHAREHQGGGTTGEVGGDRPADLYGSPLAPLGDRDELPGDAPEARGEVHWDAALAYPIPLAHPPKTLLTLRDGADLVSGRLTTIPTSFTLQDVAKALVRAAKTGTTPDIARATEELAHFVRAETLT